jgi:hypothetical protein
MALSDRFLAFLDGKKAFPKGKPDAFSEGLKTKKGF